VCGCAGGRQTRPWKSHITWRASVVRTIFFIMMAWVEHVMILSSTAWRRRATFFLSFAPDGALQKSRPNSMPLPSWFSCWPFMNALILNELMNMVDLLVAVT
jgi:hypothetical protein|tara:strand:+ start:469 stop:774 length:306 start_codon:yes stop_codon:yes gene_type:complete